MNRHDFNSIKVRLEQNVILFDELLTRFQFHKGTIRTVDHVQNHGKIPYFNSIKVRLELFAFSSYYNARLLFQFHKGTIRTLILASRLSVLKFYFNSIKVRLEPCYIVKENNQFAQFQFHKGTIRTEFYLHNQHKNYYFNSIKVRLEPVMVA